MILPRAKWVTFRCPVIMWCIRISHTFFIDYCFLEPLFKLFFKYSHVKPISSSPDFENKVRSWGILQPNYFFQQFSLGNNTFLDIASDLISCLIGLRMALMLVPVVDIWFGQVFGLDDQEVFSILLLGPLREVEGPGYDYLPVNDHDFIMGDGMGRIDISRYPHVGQESG